MGKADGKCWVRTDPGPNHPAQKKRSAWAGKRLGGGVQGSAVDGGLNGLPKKKQRGKKARGGGKKRGEWAP